MASSYSPILRTELPALGDQAGTWNITNNNNIGTFLEAAIAGTANHNTAGAVDTTLTALNGTVDEARNAVINLTGALTGSHNVICPSVSKLYLVINSTTGAFTITFKTAAGTGIVVPQGSYMLLYCNGTNVLNPMTGSQLISPTMTTPVLGTPTSGTLTNCTGLPVATGISGLGANVSTFLATPSSANLAAALTDETGTGAAVFANTPTLVTPNIGAASATSLAVSGLINTTGGQIQFPAVQVPSANANTLDDYAEGTWTPSLGGTATYTTQAGFYTKIGNMVTVRGRLAVSSIGTGSTYVISGLPFACNSTTNEIGVGSAVWFSAASTLVACVPLIPAGATTITLNSATAASASLSAVAVFGNNATVYFTVTYPTA